MSAALSARGLRVEGPGGAALVDGVDLDLPAGELTALVGESGAGKSLTALALLDLVPPPARRNAGEVLLGGERVGPGGLDPGAVRGRRVALVPQDPAAALDPVMRAGAQIAEVLRVHRGMGRAEADAAAARALRDVGVERDDHPHRLSGGQRQRALVAMALATGPSVLLADEPTASLDPPVQVAVLDLIAGRAAAGGLAVLLVSHDLGAVARRADRVAVMYAGRIVEEGPARAVLAAPRHPYTAGLMALAPRLGGTGSRRAPIPGAPPAPGARPPGCAFAPRCAFRRGACAEVPRLRDAGPGRRVACVLEADEAPGTRGRAG